MPAWYQLTTEEVLKELKTSLSGLSEDQVLLLQKEFGKNVLKAAKQKSKFAILLDQFRDVMIIILMIAAGISFFVGERTDAFVILAIIIANAWIGYSQESNAKEAVAMLQQMSAQHATVIRDNNPHKVEAGELVTGDVILLEAGDIVPADARLIDVSSFKTDEAALTGESHSIDKTTEALNTVDPGTSDQVNMIFKGTIVSNGSSKAVVTAIGMETELGKIAGLLDVEDQKTPLQKRLGIFSRQLAVIVIIICVIVFAFGVVRGEPVFLMFLTALSLAVAALPEALPAVITIALAKGARRMVKQKALVKSLPAVETLGSVTYICTDKTGTLTQNVMTVEKLRAAEGNEELLLDCMILNNEVRFSKNQEMLGDSTETALVSYAFDHGHTKDESDKRFPLVAKLPFDSVRMRMSTLHEYDGKWILFVKGAPVKMMSVLSTENEEVQKWTSLNREWAAEGLRVLFFAYRIFDQKPTEITDALEKDLDFLGTTAMIDPPREEVINAMRQCKTAGIKTVMITGDQALTAKAIAERLEMIDKDLSEVKTGADLQKLTEDEFKMQTRNVQVYARVSPGQKLNIVKALQANGEFVAMTGDGVNDAPSLKQSDIGIAMGITGTDVSKEAADMILLDDNFATIVKAVKEGRRIYENIRKFILYVLSCNLAEILIIFFAPIVGLAIPLLPIHILWINLVTDGLPGLALASEPAEADIMKQPPRPPKENLFAGGMIPKILLTGILMGAAVLLLQTWAAGQGYEVNTQQTLVFTFLCFIQLGNAISVRSSHHSLFNKRIFANVGMWLAILLTVILQLVIVYAPFTETIFKTTALDWHIMKALLLGLTACMFGIELIKYLTNRFGKSGTRSA
jgi:Ca2+-transporting ATPase